MSSKTTRKTTTTTTSTSVSGGSVSKDEQQRGRSTSRQSVTPGPSSSAGKSSPLSPTKYTRIHEKEELSNLNDRLAIYIDKVRNLESENSRLTRELRTTEETISREETKVRGMYESELADIRKILDELSKDKAKLEIDVRRLIIEKEELSASNDNLKKELNSTKSSLAVAENRLSDAQSKYNQAAQDKRKFADELKAAEKELNRLKAAFSDKERELNDEILSRVELENNYQTLREEVSFKEQVHQQQLTEIRSRKKVEVSEIDGRLTQEYEDRLFQSLQEIRDQYEIDLQNNRDELKHLYEDKINSLKSQLDSNSQAANLAIEELKQFQSRGNSINIRVEELESELASKSVRIRDLEKQLELERAQYIKEISKLDHEMTKLRDEMARQLQDYRDLMDVKVALDLEIAAYRKLLESEEARLNITPVVSPNSRRSSSKKSILGKRKRATAFFDESEDSVTSDYSISTTNKSDVMISEVCPEGKFVKLHNKGTKDVSLGGWVLTQKSGPETTNFKFYRTHKISGGSTVTIWSTDASDNHDPPESLVMKAQKWTTGDHIATSLFNSTGDEMATSDVKRQYMASSSRHRGDSGPFFKRSQLSGDLPEGYRSDERCSIM